MHLTQCGSLLSMEKCQESRYMHLVQCVSSLFMEKKARRAITYISLSVDHYFLWKKGQEDHYTHLCQCESLLYFGTRLGEPLHTSCSVWILTLYGKKARRAITYISLSVDHHFIWILSQENHYRHLARCGSLLKVYVRRGEVNGVLVGEESTKIVPKLLCCSMYCLCVNVYCTSGTG